MKIMNPPDTSLNPAAEKPESLDSKVAASSSKPIVYACSGCSDAGELADRVARQLTRSGIAEMSCLAGIGGRVKSLMTKGEKAQRILVIDGCPLNCARHTLELAGFKEFDHVSLNEAGLRKGSCPVTDERVSVGVEAAKRVLAQDVSDGLESAKH
jgi:uncharacterized metal-binding protein